MSATIKIYLDNLSADVMPKLITSPTNPIFRGGRHSSTALRQITNTPNTDGTYPPGAFCMESLLSDLEEIVVDKVGKKVDYLVPRVTALEEDTETLKKTLSTFEKRVLEFQDVLDNTREHTFKHIARKVDRMTKEMAKLPLV